MTNHPKIIALQDELLRTAARRQRLPERLE
jgi:hypothetical protein